ncbi:hypothetical protein HC031_01195 [Planosporangium thailandense]|uniref:Glycosyltransferase RgtA/B/C/D-like domain-containing protein n=1 Tax=Planosporangium thailandense TaxID=765197 RepID=A0ABX0XQT4_9ACTN|nr:hypothetical protein [Planosporangium thailandense]NJC68342.1 hypothetical protein [Planosporangium thailandense]
MTSTIESPVREESVEPRLRSRLPVGSRYAWSAVALVLAWCLPVLTDILGVDWILPILLLVATASLMRSGRTVLDRLVFAAGLLFGATCAMGLLLSMWPWHLAPVAVAGTAFSGLVLTALGLRRRPSLPRTFGAADWLVVGFTLLASIVPLSTLRHTTPGWLLGRVAYGDDFSRHYALYDEIRAAGGYVFLHRHSTPFVPPELKAYPQGSHFLYALLENFLRSSSHASSTLGTFNHLVLFLLASEVFLYLTVLWAIRWVAGVWLSGWAALPLLGAAATYLAFGDPVRLVPDGYVSQVPGLAVLVITVALLARPVARTREQLVLVGAVVVATSFVYYLSLPVVLVSVLAWLVRYRRRLRGHRVALWLSVAVTGVLSLVTPLTNMRANNGAQLLLPGGASMMSRWLTILVTAVPLAALCLRKVRRLPVWQLAGVQVATAALLALAIYAYQMVMLGHSIYYFEKTLMQLAMVSLVAGGAPAIAVLSGLRSGARPPRVPWPRWVVTAGAAVTCLLAAVGVVVKPAPYVHSSRGLLYLRDDGATPYVGEVVAQTLQRFPRNDGYVDLVFFYPPDGQSPTAWWTRTQQAYATLYVGTIQRNYVHAGPMYGFVHPSLTPDMPPAALMRHLLQEHVRARIITEQPELIAEYRRLAAVFPEAGLVVVDARDWLGKPTA